MKTLLFYMFIKGLEYLYNML